MRSLSILCLCIISLVGFAASPRAKGHLETNSVTPIEQKAGKWLMTLSVGMQVPKKSTLQLRNLVTQVFPTTKGGLYNHIIDIDDKNASSVSPIKSVVLEKVNGMRVAIEQFKRENPGQPTMVFLSWTGHGLTNEKGEYSFSLLNGQLSGGEIVDIIKSLQVDEVVLLLQSCESGSLIDNHFSAESIAGLRNQIVRLTETLSTKLAVITPISQYVSSPTHVWEHEVLRPAFFDKKADVNNDDIVTYEEWKNYVLQLACQHPLFSPKNIYKQITLRSVPFVGVDPQFFDTKLPGQLPFFLTRNGVKKYQENNLPLPIYSNEPARIYPETTRICQAAEETVVLVHNVTDDRLGSVLANSQDVLLKKRIIARLQYNYGFKLDKDLVDELVTAYRYGDNVELKSAILRLIVSRGEARENVNYQELLASELQNWEGLRYQLKLTVLSAAWASVRLAEFKELFRQIYNRYSSEYFQVWAVAALAGIGGDDFLPFILDVFLTNQHEMVRAGLLDYLPGDVDNETLTKIISRYWSETAMVKAAIIELIGRRELLNYVNLVEVGLNSADEALQANSIVAIEQLKKDAAVGTIVEILKSAVSDRIRYQCVSVLFKYMANQAVVETVLQTYATDKSYYVRMSAINALGGAGKTDKVVAVITNALNSDESGQVRAAALRSISRILSREEVEPMVLNAITSGKVFELRAEACSIAGAHGMHRALPLLTHARDYDESSAVRLAAQMAIDQLL